MEQIFTIKNHADNRCRINRAWLIVAARQSKSSDGPLVIPRHSHVGKYRLVIEDTICNPESVITYPTSNQTLEEGLLLVLGRCMTDFDNRIGYDMREHGEYPPIYFDIFIYSSSQSFLTSLHEWISTPEEEIDGNVPGIFAKDELMRLRKCAKVAGFYVDKKELIEIGQSEDPAKTIRNLS